MAKRETIAAITLTADLEAFAVTQINAFEKDFAKAKGGINNMSNHLLDVAKRAEKDAGTDNAKRDALYKAICRHAETVYKQEHMKEGKELPIKVLLPFWPVAKAQVQAGLNAGLKMAGFKTVYEVVNATPRKERGTQARKEGKADGEEGAVSLPAGKEGDALGAAMVRLNKTVRLIVVQRPTLTGATAKAIEALCDSLDEMANLEEQAESKSTPAGQVGMPASQVA